MDTEELEKIKNRLDELTKLQNKQTESIQGIKKISLWSQILQLLIFLVILLQVFVIGYVLETSLLHRAEFGKYTRVGDRTEGIERKLEVLEDLLLYLIKHDKEEKLLPQ